MTSENSVAPGKLGRAVFCGLARNGNEHLPTVLANLDAMATLFDEAAFILAENDSTDGAKETLRAWCAERPNARLIEYDGLAAQAPIRTLRLTRLRRLLLALVKADFSEFDYMFLVDCDDAGAYPQDLEVIRRAVEFLKNDADCAAVFGNQDGLYYDMWALRCAGWCPLDVWEEQLDYVIAHRCSDEDAFENTFRLRGSVKIEQTVPPIPVDSAFGGYGIYKIPSILLNRRNYTGYKVKSLPTAEGPRDFGLQTCEHVSFNMGFRELGQTLYILPWWTTRETPQIHVMASGYRQLYFDLAALGADR